MSLPAKTLTLAAIVKCDEWLHQSSIVGHTEMKDESPTLFPSHNLVIRLFNSTLLRLLLFTLGQGLALTSRISPSVRSQITRTVTFEISTDDGVVRRWHFNGQQRWIATGAGHSRSPAQALRFPSSGQALRVLLSPRCIGEIVDGLQNGTIRLQGSLFLTFWFFGLTRKLAPIGRENGRRETGPRGPLPDRYVQHDPRANGSEQIIIEPAVTQLDPHWTNAWEQRAKLLIVRATTGEPMPEG